MFRVFHVVVLLLLLLAIKYKTLVRVFSYRVQVR